MTGHVRTAPPKLSRTEVLTQAGIASSSLLLLTASLMSWVTSGATDRNSYSTFRVAQRLGIDGLTVFRLIWFLVPVLTAAVIFALAGKWVRSAAVVLLLQSLIVGFGGIAVWRASVPIGSGPPVAVVLALLGLGAGVFALVGSKGSLGVMAVPPESPSKT